MHKISIRLCGGTPMQEVVKQFICAQNLPAPPPHRSRPVVSAPVSCAQHLIRLPDTTPRIQRITKQLTCAQNLRAHPLQTSRLQTFSTVRNISRPFPTPIRESRFPPSFPVRNISIPRSRCGSRRHPRRSHLTSSQEIIRSFQTNV